MFDSLFNFFNVAAGRDKEFEELIAAGNVDAVIAKMDSRHDKTVDAANDYDPQKHFVCIDPKRQGKEVKNKKGERVDFVKQWKLPIPYPQYINEIALVFIYGQPVKWGCSTEGTDNAFGAFTELLHHLHFNSKVRQMKRYAGAYTQSALLFRVFRNEDNKPDCQIRVLSHEKGDEIFSRWDQYENLLSVGWKYTVTEGNVSVEHFDLFLPKMIYHCKRNQNGWDVAPEPNLIGKIPVILDRQDKEWAGVEPQIEREEYIVSRTADTNDYFADPQEVVNIDVVKNMPDKDAPNKTLLVNGEGVDARTAVGYVTWDSAPESKKMEVEWLQNHILSKTFTPNIDFENMKSLSNVTGKALKQMMILANIKAQKHKEQHDELMDRAASLMKAIIGNVLDVSLKGECDNMVITHEFQEPFGEDIAEAIENITKAVDGGILSKETGVEQSPMTKDAQLEKERIAKELEEATAAQRDIFAQQSFLDNGTAE